MTRREFGIIAASAAGPLAAADKEGLVFIGTYTRGGSKGIYSYRFDPASGKLTEVGVAAEMQNPSFLYVTPDGKRLYAVGEANTGMVKAFTVDRASGKLTALNEKPSGANGPCHVTADAAGKKLFIAHYGSGSTASFRLNPDGSLGERASLIQHSGSSANPKRQEGPHAHSVNVSKNQKYLVAADLGIDQFIVYAIGPDATLTQHSAAKVKPGSGPRHFSFAPSYRYGYGVNELSSEVSVFEWNEAKGELREVQTISTLPADFKGNSTCAEILTHPSGKFVYASNRGHDSIAMYSVGSGGKLTSLGTASTEGKTPRNFRIDPSGAWTIAANQDSGNLVVMRIDKSSGKLSPTGDQAKVPFPVCVKFVV